VLQTNKFTAYAASAHSKFESLLASGDEGRRRFIVPLNFEDYKLFVTKLKREDLATPEWYWINGGVYYDIAKSIEITRYEKNNANALRQFTDDQVKEALAEKYFESIRKLDPIDLDEISGEEFQDRVIDAFQQQPLEFSMLRPGEERSSVQLEVSKAHFDIDMNSLNNTPRVANAQTIYTTLKNFGCWNFIVYNPTLSMVIFAQVSKSNEGRDIKHIMPTFCRCAWTNISMLFHIDSLEKVFIIVHC